MSDPKLERIIRDLPPEAQEDMRAFFAPANIRKLIDEALPHARRTAVEAVLKFPHDRAKQREYVERQAREHAEEVHNA